MHKIQSLLRKPELIFFPPAFQNQPGPTNAKKKRVNFEAEI